MVKAIVNGRNDALLSERRQLPILAGPYLLDLGIGMGSSLSFRQKRGLWPERVFFLVDMWA